MFDFTIKEFILGNGTGTPTFQFYRRGFNLGGTGSQPSWQDIILSGNTALTLVNAKANGLNYLKLFGKCEQRNLPEGHTQLEYVYMTIDSYIKIEDLPISSGYKVEFDFQTTTLSSNLRNYIGGRASGVSAGGGFRLTKLASSNNNRVVLYGFEAGTEYYDPTAQFQANTRYKYTYNNGVCTLESGGSVVSTRTFTVNDNNSTNWGINAYTGGTGWQTETDGIYVYSLKVWNTQGELVMDLVPAVQKGTVPVVCFYDMVTGTIKTATEGTFMAGAEAVPSPDTPMDIVCNNGVLKARHQSGLPLGYTLLDNIASTGTQYVDIDVVVDTAELRIVADFIPVGTPSDSTINMLCGTVEQSGMDVFILNDSIIYLGGDNNCTYPVGSSVNGKEIIYDGKFSATNPRRSLTGTIDGVAFSKETDSSINTASINKNVRIFGHGNNYRSKIKLKFMQIYKNNVLAFNGLPVLDIAANEYGIYDTVSNKFHGNSGTGTFIAGSTVSDAVEIYTDGTTETVEVTGKNLFDKTTYIAGEYYNSSGNIVENPNYGMTGFIPMKSGQTFALSGRTPSGIALFDTSQVWQRQVTGQTFTAPYDGYFVVSVASGQQDTLQIEAGSTATTYEPYFNGGSATAEMLLAIGSYQDVQSILDGDVTRNVGVKVLDGTEDWRVNTGENKRFFIQNDAFFTDWAKGFRTGNDPQLYCTHSPFEGYLASGGQSGSNIFNAYLPETGTCYLRFTPDTLDFTTVSQWQQYLADQYANGTPVIIVYPLATATTETVESQALTIQAGTNVVEITQASIDNLELEVSYKAGVEVTVTEIEDAQLSNSVTVTVS